MKASNSNSNRNKQIANPDGTTGNGSNNRLNLKITLTKCYITIFAEIYYNFYKHIWIGVVLILRLSLKIMCYV